MMHCLRRSLTVTALLVTALLASGPALAHPHVWVTVKSELLYAPDGRVSAIRHAWTFDPGYSAFSVQGLDKNNDGAFTGDELAELAKVNVESLNEFGYFTQLKANGAKQAFEDPKDYALAYADKALTLTFTLPLKAPALGSKALSMEVYDPSFFVDFRMADGEDAVRLTGAPTGCKTTVTRPKSLDAAQQQRLSEAFFEALTAASKFGEQFANRAIVACP